MREVPQSFRERRPSWLLTFYLEIRAGVDDIAVPTVEAGRGPMDFCWLLNHGGVGVLGRLDLDDLSWGSLLFLGLVFFFMHFPLSFVVVDLFFQVD